MNLQKWIKDSFVIGLLSGLFSLIVVYFLLAWFQSVLINYFDNPYLLRPPALQFITLLINIIFFRVLIINFEKEKMGKGFLISVVTITLVYLYIFYGLNK